MNLPMLKNINFTKGLLIAIAILSLIPIMNNDKKAESNSDYLSPIIKTPNFFSALAAEWHQDLKNNQAVRINVRFMNGNHWSSWHRLEADSDGINEADEENPSAFLPINLTNTYQYKIETYGNSLYYREILKSLRFTHLDAPYKEITRDSRLLASSVPIRKRIAQESNPAFSLNTNGTLKIISRAQWGADESLRLYKESNTKPVVIKTESDFENKYSDELKIIRTVESNEKGEKLTWPLKYPEKISKIIIHHTASIKDLDEPARAVRNIYYWHTVTRGWGDIGYNYLIDQQGNIYEGKYGGDSVVGAHAGRGNVGSIGIAVLGNYEDEDVPDNVLKSLTALIKAKVEKYGIDPLGASAFRGENMPNIGGHRDIMSTTCPGAKLYAQLPALRLAVRTGFKPIIIDRGQHLAINQQYDFQPSLNLQLPDFDPGEEKNVTLTLKNTGNTSWGPGTFLVLNRDNNAYTFFKTDQQPQSTAINHETKPGEDASFTMSLATGYQGGFTAIEFVMMVDGSKKLEKYLSMPVQIKQPIYDYEVNVSGLSKKYSKTRQRLEFQMEFKNKGNVTWQGTGKNRFALGSEQPRDHINKLLARHGNRLGQLEESTVRPGETGHVTIILRAPAEPGAYKEYFTPLLEGVAWFKPYNNNFIDLYAYKNEYEGVFNGKSTSTLLAPGEKRNLWFNLQNIGGVIWNEKEGQMLDFDIKNNSQLEINDMKLEGGQLAPGNNGKVSFNVTAPQEEGYYFLQFKPKLNSHFLLSRSINFFLRVDKNAPKPENSEAPSVTPQSISAINLGDTSNNIRIDIGFRGNPVISGNGPFALLDGQKTIAEFKTNERVGVSYGNNIYQINGMTEKYHLSNPPRFIPIQGTILRVDNFERKSISNNNSFDNEYKGVLEARWYNNEIHTINEVGLEDYLKGTGEIKEQEPTEKLKAIIVVARTYAAFYMKMAEKFPGAPFHLTDDPETSQKYIGYSAEKRSPNTIKATSDTVGLVVTYKDKLVKTPYFHSDDGRTRSAEEVWGWKDTPYLVSVPDPYCAGKTLQGHGVGLSGCGSLGMAKTGKSYEEIIKYYYQGVEIKKIE